MSVSVCQTLSPIPKVGDLTLVWRWYVGSTLMETVLEHLDDDAGVHKVEAEMVQCSCGHITLPLQQTTYHDAHRHCSLYLAMLPHNVDFRHCLNNVFRFCLETAS